MMKTFQEISSKISYKLFIKTGFNMNVSKNSKLSNKKHYFC